MRGKSGGRDAEQGALVGEGVVGLILGDGRQHPGAADAGDCDHRQHPQRLGPVFGHRFRLTGITQAGAKWECYTVTNSVSIEGCFFT